MPSSRDRVAGLVSRGSPSRGRGPDAPTGRRGPGVPSVTPVKRARRSKEEIRDLLLETGISILRAEGLGLGAESVTFKKVFDRLEEHSGIRLTNASVIGRAWRNQAEFQTDVLAAIVLQGIEREIEVTIDAVVPTLSETDLSTPEAREATLRELCRLGGAANLQAVRQSSNWPLWIGIWALAANGEQHEQRQRIIDALVSGSEAFDEQMELAYTAMAGLLGFRLRERFTLRQFAIAADCLGQGCGFRDRIDGSDMEHIVRPTGPGGRLQEWTLFSVGFEALVRQFFELDPDWRPAGDD